MDYLVVFRGQSDDKVVRALKKIPEESSNITLDRFIELFRALMGGSTNLINIVHDLHKIEPGVVGHYLFNSIAYPINKGIIDFNDPWCGPTDEDPQLRLFYSYEPFTEN